MPAPVHTVLFLCTGNSARSILAEAYLNHRGGGQFRAYSAGSHPTGSVNPQVLELLEACAVPVSGLRSKSWDEFAAPGGRRIDFIITVCDKAAGEMCPVWPGRPVTAHWGVPDPAFVQGTREQRMRAVEQAFQMLQRRIDLFTSLPLASLDRLALNARVREIGRS